MKYCKICNEYFRKNDFFCPECGTILIEKEPDHSIDFKDNDSGSVQNTQIRNDDVKIGIYKLVNDRTNEVFVSKSNDIDKAFKRHMANLRNGRHHNVHLQEDFDNGDTFSLVILELFSYYDKKELNRATIEWVTKEDSYNHGYNRYWGGGWNPYEQDPSHSTGGRRR